MKVDIFVLVALPADIEQYLSGEQQHHHLPRTYRYYQQHFAYKTGK
jgi:hypothetical protein